MFLLLCLLSQSLLSGYSCCLPAEEIYFSHDSVKPFFRNHASILTLLEELLSGAKTALDVQALDVAEFDGRYHVVTGNRRLWVYRKYAQVTGKSLLVPVYIQAGNEILFKQKNDKHTGELRKPKYTTTSRGSFVLVEDQSDLFQRQLEKLLEPKTALLPEKSEIQRKVESMLTADIVRKAEEGYLKSSVEQGDLDKVRIALENYCIDSVELKSDLVLKAMEAGRFGIAETLLSYGASANARNNMGKTPLHIIMAKAHTDWTNLVVRCAIQSDVNSQDQHGKTPLHYACTCKDANIELLLTFGASARIQDFSGKTALHYAAVHADARAIEKMIELEKGGLVKIRDNDGRTAACLAKLAKRKKICNLLVSSFQKYRVDP